MGLANFLEQKALLDDTKNDLENMQIYVKNINDCLQAIDTCWVGGRDKFIIENTIVSHLNEAHLATKELNGFRQTATFALMKMNELGSLNGLIAPFINPISLVNIFIDFFTNSKININTYELKRIADRIDKERQRLNETKFAITKINNILDFIILNLFGLNALLKTIDRRVANLITENQRIVNAIRHICGLYESTENKIKKQIDSIMELGSTGAIGILSNPKSFAEFAKDRKSIWVFAGFINGYIEPDIVDKAAIALSGWNDPFKKIIGQYEESLIEKNLAELLKKMNNQTEIIKIPDEIKQGIKLFVETGKWNKGFYEKYADLIDGMGGIEKLLKYGNKGLEAVEYLFTDYSNSIETLEMLRNSNITDPILNKVVDGLISKYSDKYIGSISNVIDYCVNEGFDKSFEGIVETLAGGGLYSIVSLSSDILTNITGIDDYAETLETNAASTIYSNNFVIKYQEIMTKINYGQYNETDLITAEKYFDITKASLIQQYESGLVIANTDEQRALIQADLVKLNKLVYAESISSGLEGYSLFAGGGGGGGGF